MAYMTDYEDIRYTEVLLDRCSKVKDNNRERVVHVVVSMDEESRIQQ